MKKRFSLFLALCLLVSAVGGLASCRNDHVHEYSVYWTFDDNHHWHDCIENDGAFAEKAAHVWNEGVITQEADEETVGIITYRCTVCGHERTERYEFDPSGGATTTVREDQMKRAFDKERFRNVTMTYYAENSGVFARKTIYFFTEQGAYWYQVDEDGEKYDERYDIITDAGYDIYTRADDDTWQVESMTKQQFAARYIDFPSRFAAQYAVFAENYKKLHYDEESQEYQIYDAKISRDNVSYAALHFEAKNLIYLKFLRPISESLEFATDLFGNYQEFTFKDYGVTTFEIPTNVAAAD